MKFLHLSDTHLRRDYSNDRFTDAIFDVRSNPTLRFKKLLSELRNQDFEFALITGDLVHEGTKEDYALFRSIWQEEVGDLPYYFCRGNHDMSKDFLEGMDVQGNAEGDYISCQFFNGLRIISLDSAQDDHHEGKISLEQMETLKNWLKEPAEKGTLLLLHHPLNWEVTGIPTETPDGFEKIIAESDIIGIFCGHIHQSSISSYAGKMQYMTESIAFGVEEDIFGFEKDKYIFVNRCGYNVCSLTKDSLFVYPRYISPEQTVIGRFPKG